MKLFCEYSAIGSYWERGNQNEIDIVAVNEDEKKMLFVEVKRNEKKIDLKALKAKAEKLMRKHRGYEFFFEGFSLKDIKKKVYTYSQYC